MTLPFLMGAAAVGWLAGESIRRRRRLGAPEDPLGPARAELERAREAYRRAAGDRTTSQEDLESAFGAYREAYDRWQEAARGGQPARPSRAPSQPAGGNPWQAGTREHDLWSRIQMLADLCRDRNRFQEERMMEEWDETSRELARQRELLDRDDTLSEAEKAWVKKAVKILCDTPPGGTVDVPPIQAPTWGGPGTARAPGGTFPAGASFGPQASQPARTPQAAVPVSTRAAAVPAGPAPAGYYGVPSGSAATGALAPGTRLPTRVSEAFPRGQVTGASPWAAMPSGQRPLPGTPSPEEALRASMAYRSPAMPGLPGGMIQAAPGMLAPAIPGGGMTGAGGIVG